MKLKIAFNNSHAKLFDSDKIVNKFMCDLLSYEVDGAKDTYEYQTGSWDGMATFFNTEKNSFPAGFVMMVKKNLEMKGHEVLLVCGKQLEPLGDVNPEIPGFSQDPKYDYQMETVRRLVARNRMIAQIATGGGKSCVCQYTYLRIKRKTLFITTRGVLMHQMKKQFEQILRPHEIGVVGDGEFYLPKTHDGIVFGMVQTFASALKADSKDKWERIEQEKRKQAMLDLLATFEMIILEEAHEVGGDSYYEVVQACKNAQYRLALTATPFMRDSGEGNMRLMAAVGDVGIKVSERLLIERGILAKPYFKYIQTKKPADITQSTPWMTARERGIVHNGARNVAIVNEAKRAVNAGLSVLILTQLTAHGDVLKEMIANFDMRVRYIHGKHDNEARQNAITALKEGRIDVLIGSTILDTGVDVPSVGMIILAGGGKAEVALRQRIGRGLRAKKTGPNVAFVVDFCDKFNRILSKHAKERRSIVESTPGFVENILKDDADFDYSVFLKTK